MEANPTIVFYGPNQVGIENRTIPQPEKGELLIKTLKTLISTGTELTILERKDVPVGSGWDTYGKFPYLPGYDNIGIVIGVGDEVDPLWIGKKVATYGIHAAYVTVSVEEARIIHREINDEHAAFFTIAEIVMNSIRRGKIIFGESVLVYGLGLLGQMAVRLVRICGATPVMALDISPMRLALLPEDSSVIPIDALDDDLLTAVERITKGRKADVIFEVTGIASLIPKEFKLLRNQGRFVVLSSPRGDSQFDFHDLCNSPSFEIIGAHNASHPVHATLDNPWTMRRDAELFFDLVANSELDMEKLITHRAHFTKALEMYEMLINDRSMAMGVLLDWT